MCLSPPRNGEFLLPDFNEYEKCSCHVCIKFQLHSNVACHCLVCCKCHECLPFYKRGQWDEVHAWKAISRPVCTFRCYIFVGVGWIENKDRELKIST